MMKVILLVKAKRSKKRVRVRACVCVKIFFYEQKLYFSYAYFKTLSNAYKKLSVFCGCDVHTNIRLSYEFFNSTVLHYLHLKQFYHLHLDFPTAHVHLLHPLMA